MARRKAVVLPEEIEKEYPYDRDVTHVGRLARVPGRRGVFKVFAHETSRVTGASWWMLLGPQTAGDPGQWTHVREIELVPERSR